MTVAVLMRASRDDHRLRQNVFPASQLLHLIVQAFEELLKHYVSGTQRGGNAQKVRSFCKDSSS